jgi:hypothetical protein
MYANDDSQNAALFALCWEQPTAFRLLDPFRASIQALERMRIWPVLPEMEIIATHI